MSVGVCGNQEVTKPPICHHEKRRATGQSQEQTAPHRDQHILRALQCS